MNLYVISQSAVRGYDTYDSAVVVAISEDQARRIRPAKLWEEAGGSDDDSLVTFIPLEPDEDGYIPGERAWPNDPTLVHALLIGKAVKSYTQPCVICASFNAG